MFTDSKKGNSRFPTIYRGGKPMYLFSLRAIPLFLPPSSSISLLNRWAERKLFSPLLRMSNSIGGKKRRRRFTKYFMLRKRPGSLVKSYTTKRRTIFPHHCFDKKSLSNVSFFLCPPAHSNLLQSRGKEKFFPFSCTRIIFLCH